MPTKPPMKVKELIAELEKQNPEATVWVDWDREGGNENEVSRIEPFDPRDGKPAGAIALR